MLKQLLELSPAALAGLALAGLIFEYNDDEAKIQEYINQFIALQNERLN